MTKLMSNLVSIPVLCYTILVTEALRIFYLTEYPLLSNRPTLGKSPYTFRDKLVNVCQSGLFISKWENRVILPRIHAVFGKVNTAMCLFAFIVLTISPLSNLTGGARWP